MNSRFCGGCGRRLAGNAGGSAAEGAPRRGERRQLTVLFCDLAGSTALSQRLDAEDLCEVIEVYRALCTSSVERYEGHVAQYLGDGILAYFSYPTAHEDDAERAVRAGLEILAALREVNPRLQRRHHVELAVKIGIHTGPVVVDVVAQLSQRETLALGLAVNVASRLADLAAPGSVLITAHTQRLVQGLFVTRLLGVHLLRGISEGIELHEVVETSGAHGRIDVAVSQGLTPLVGREAELAALLERWESASRGRGQVVVVGGDPGIGKSRLLQALRERLEHEPHTWFECRSSPHHRHTAFHPVTERLREGLRFGHGERAELRLARIEAALDRAGIDAPDALPLVASLLSVELREPPAVAAMSPEKRRRRTLEILVSWLGAAARRQPMVLVIEDLHWADPSTLELLDRVVGATASLPMLVLATHRPSFEPAWAAAEHVLRMTLQPLTRGETLAMVEDLTRGAELPRAVLEQVVVRTDGVPLYVEELTKSLLEAREAGEGPAAHDGPSAPALSIPATLQDSLTARLDRLGASKEIAQLAAVLGRDFARAHLESVSDADPAELRRALEHLEQAGFLRTHGETPALSYSFKHALIQEAAYQSLLNHTRQAWHARIARRLEQRFPELATSEPEALARHCDAGGLVERAVGHYERAADRATQRSAYAEAIGHLRRAIELLQRLPANRERDAWELRLQMALAPPLVAATGWGSVEAEQAYARALQLSEGVGETAELFRLMRGMITFRVSRSELDTARGLCTRLLRLAEAEKESSLLLLAHQQMAIVLYYLGDPVEALAHYEQAIALYDPREHAALVHFHGEDLGVFAKTWMSWALWMVGQPERALACGLEGIERAHAISHPFSLAYALLWAAVLRLLRRERKEAYELADAARRIGEEHDFAFHAVGGRSVCALARIDPAEPPAVVEAAIADFKVAVAGLTRTGTVVTQPKLFGALAEAYRRVGRSAEADAIVSAGFGYAERTSQPFWNADLHRLRGELLLDLDPRAQERAERHFVEALEIARKQRARALELRAATSYARLLRDQGRHEEARAVLAPVYASFREGFGLADLRDAKALLDELGESGAAQPPEGADLEPAAPRGASLTRARGG